MQKIQKHSAQLLAFLSGNTVSARDAQRGIRELFHSYIFH